jgi:penicillin amidase
MRTTLGFIVILLVGALIYVLDRPMGSLPAIGRLIDPVNGCWANTEPVKKNFSTKLKIAGLKHPATVWIDERLVPHVHAADEHDLYFLQGYLHAKFRLWQMDMETRAAGGRVSEVIGVKALGFDRKQRRKGMVYAAENSLKAMEADPRTKLMVDAYTEGINHFIGSMRYRGLPIEYKLMGFKPEKWTNIRSALLLKYMADDLTGKTDDIEFSYLRDLLSPAEFQLLFPNKITGSTPVIPAGTAFEKPSLAVPTAPADSLAFPHFKTTDFGEIAESGKGSNNWAISGSRTASGAAILCDDPHLGLNLPSLWYEMQLQTEGVNVYGASLPGCPGIVIGFNDSVAWGFTNNYRDVKDFYLIKPVEGDNNKYWFGNQQLNFTKRIERIVVKNGKDFIDTVRYSIHGPLAYEEHYSDKGGIKKPVAMCWMAHRPTNELLSIYLMNTATSYETFVDAIQHFECPAQNIVYADRSGNIALWGQGQFVNKWKEQGTYVMNGADSTTLWKDLIPMRENPHVLNPPQGYVSSANQSVTDDSYPYWYNGNFIELRAWRINQVLAGLQKATVEDMFALQNDTHSLLAENALPVLLKYTSDISDQYINGLRNWDYNLALNSEQATLFQIWWRKFYDGTWAQYFAGKPFAPYPLHERTMQLLLDSSKHKAIFKNLPELATRSYQQAVDSFKRIKGGTQWYQVKNTTINHLTKLAPFSFSNLKTGGWGNTVNAMKGDHGPSWRMVVQMGKEIEAYAVYPGGQSGNPGSSYYATFLNHWVEGKYYKLLFLPRADKQNDSRIKYTMTIQPRQ